MGPPNEIPGDDGTRVQFSRQGTFLNVSVLLSTSAQQSSYSKCCHTRVTTGTGDGHGRPVADVEEESIVRVTAYGYGTQGTCRQW